MVEAFFADGHELYRGYVQVGTSEYLFKHDIYQTSSQRSGIKYVAMIMPSYTALRGCRRENLKRVGAERQIHKKILKIS